jgi:hypothetical protein
MIPLIAPILSLLANKGLDLLSGAIEGGADKAIDFVAEKTGIDLKTKTSLSGAEIATLKELERLNTKDLQDFQIANKKLDMENTNSARDMQKSALDQPDNFSKRYIYHLATLWSVFSMLFISAIAFIPIPMENVRIVDTILGFMLGTIISAIINFFFGSSHSSKEKDGTISKHIERRG